MSLTPEELAPALRGEDGAVFLSLRVQPGAKRARVMGMYGERLRVAITARPVDGKANRALIVWVAKLLGLRKADVQLVGGQSSRDKRLRCDITRADAVQALIKAT